MSPPAQYFAPPPALTLSSPLRYGCFIAFECAGVFTAFLLSHQTRVRRKDGSKVANVERLPWKTEFKMLGRHLALKRTLFMIIPYAYS